MRHLQLRCAEGCAHFLTTHERQRAAQSQTWKEHWHTKLNSSGFCAPLDGQAALCRMRRPTDRLEPPLELPHCCRKLGCVTPVNLMKRAYSPLNMARAAELLNESRRYGRASADASAKRAPGVGRRLRLRAR